MKLKAFTLVELIVVMGVLAILSTIGFMSYGGYQEDSRDASRLSNIGEIDNMLELYKIKYTKYPKPSNPQIITYSGSEVWTQGTFGESIINQLKGISYIPLDPLSKQEFVYSRLNNHQEYQIASVLESDIAKIDFQNTYAAGRINAKAYIVGNYNGKIVKVDKNNSTYLLAVPTIISGDTSLFDIEQITLQNKLLYKGYKNLPSTFTNTRLNINGEENLNLMNAEHLVVFSGSLNSLNNEAFQISFVESMQKAFSGTLIKNESKIKTILDINISNEGETGLFTKTIVNEQFGTKIVLKKKNGTCGADNGEDLFITPTNSCDSGFPSYISDSGEGGLYSWICEGINGGKDKSCDANHLAVVPCDPIISDFEDNTLGTWSIITGTANTSWQTESAGTTNSSSTGPIVAAGGTYYIYTEASGNSNKTYTIEHDVTCQNSINFDYHAYGATMGTLLVQEFDGSTWSDIHTISGQTHLAEADAYLNTGEIGLSSGTSKVRLHYTSGASFKGDFSIDNIMIGKNISCAIEPGYSNTNFTKGSPTIEGTAWQNTNSGFACYYTCTDGYTGNDCNIDPLINGSCGGSAGLNYSMIPTNLCSAGVATSVTDNGVGSTYDWSCNGTGGGSDISCNANHVLLAADMQLTYSGVLAGETIELPFQGTVNITTIDWGDGGFNSCAPSTTSNTGVSCTYANAGDYVIKIVGNSTRFGGFNSLGIEKLVSVDKWDGLGLTSFSFGFEGASTLVSVPTSLPVGVTNLKYMFYNASVFNQNLNTWNTASVTNMGNMFSNASLFNNGELPGLSTNSLNFDTANVTDMSAQFKDANSFNQPVSSFDTSKVTTMSEMFRDAILFNQSLNAFDTSKVINMFFIFAGASVFNNGEGVGLPTNPLSFNTAEVTTMQGMFFLANSFNQSLSSFNTAKVTNMDLVFNGATVFNQSLSSFNTAEVTDMGSMFNGATVFDQSLSSFNTAKVTDMGFMFNGATVFDQSLSSFNTVEVTDMSEMFNGATVFNQSLSNFNTAKVTNMTRMFSQASEFNQSLSSFNTAEVTDMHGIFFNASKFNNGEAAGLSGNPLTFNMLKVTGLTCMFCDAISYNQPLGPDFITSAAISMHSFFDGAILFNQPVLTLDVSGATILTEMFYRADSFNQSVGHFDTTNVTDMRSMFNNAKVFNQDISGWCVSGITSKPVSFDNLANAIWLSGAPANQPQWGVVCP